MMSVKIQKFWSLLDIQIGEFSLLKHPFYQAWQNGELTLDHLKSYAKEYYHLETNFPRFLSRIHSTMEDPNCRTALIKNLISEEGEVKTHRDLWLQFVDALGVDSEEMKKHKPSQMTQAAIDWFMRISSDGDWKKGVAALYAYESQQPYVARTKCHGLIQHYGFSPNSAGLEFFQVHQEADLWHSSLEKELLSLESGLQDQEVVLESARQAAQELWKFLDGVCEQIQLPVGNAVICSLN